MNIAGLKEQGQESRAALSPKTVKTLVAMGFNVFCQTQMGLASGWSDEDYASLGAMVLVKEQDIVSQANVLVAVNAPSIKLLKKLPKHCLIVSQIDYAMLDAFCQACRDLELRFFSLTHLPRITRAQSMDALSSQTNLAGYRAVISAVYHYGRLVPLMMTAAGVVPAAKVLVLGAGVAGLQAIATARRLGAEVYAFDVRPAVKEQVESLGASFVAVEASEQLEAQSGYATQTSPAYQVLQAQTIAEYAALSDIIICTALIPGKVSPILLTKAMVSTMRAGSVIVDMAGNCELYVKDKTIDATGVMIIGDSHLAGQVAGTASALYANNILNVMQYLWDDTKKQLHFAKDDAIIEQALLVPVLKQEE